MYFFLKQINIILADVSASLASKYLVHLSQFDIPYQPPSHCCHREGHESKGRKQTFINVLTNPQIHVLPYCNQMLLSLRLAILNNLVYNVCVCLKLYFLANFVVFNHFLTVFFLGGGNLTFFQSVLSPNAWEIKGRLSKEPCLEESSFS